MTSRSLLRRLKSSERPQWEFQISASTRYVYNTPKKMPRSPVGSIENTGLFISPSGISELDCATTKTDTAERSISIGRESLHVLFVLGALAYFQVSPLGGSREEKWHSQWIRKRSVSWNLPKLSQLWLCNGGFGSWTTQNHLQTKKFVNGTWNSSRVAACSFFLY